ncbi:MAG: hypothetical protein V4813_15985 [Gemmatimonadota bacterium]
MSSLLLLAYWLIATSTVSMDALAVFAVIAGAVALASALLNYLDDASRSAFLRIARALLLLSLPVRRDDDRSFSRARLADVDLRAMMRKLEMSQRHIHRTYALTKDDRAAIVAEISENLRSDAGANVLSSLEERFGDAVARSRRVDELRSLADRTKVRLLDEVSALSKRSNLNLVIGILTTVAAVALLSYIVLTAQLAVVDWRAILPGYLLRLSLVVFIEVFAFFFLRMYKVSLQEIKYFQNELTNVEARFIALEAAIGAEDTDATRSIITHLATLDRNSPLQQGQSTVELERLRIENGSIKYFLQAIGKFSPSASPDNSK